MVFQSAMLTFSPHVQGEGLADPSTKDNNNYLSSLVTEHYFKQILERAHFWPA